MSVGILLITHSGIGSALLNVASGTFGSVPLEISQLSVSRDPDIELLIEKASYLVRKLDAGQGVLVLTDMFGSTPSNVARELQQQGLTICVVTGLNLPMLFRVLNYPNLALKQLAKKAISGGIEGIFEPLTELDLSDTTNAKKKSLRRINRQKSLIID